MHFKMFIEQKYAELIYNGLWFSPLKDSLQAFIESSQTKVSGLVRLKLYKSSCIVVGRKSEQSLYNQALATYDHRDYFEHDCAQGFIKLFGLDLKNYYFLNKP